jgi:hypothetical protein
MFLASLLGATYSIFFHAFILIEFFRTPAGRLVVAACNLGGPKMIKTFMMGFIMILIWAQVTWLYFREWAHKASGQCSTVYQCTFKAIQSGFRGDLDDLHGNDHGEIRGSEYESPLNPWEDLYYQAEVLMVLAFYLLWEYILAGIIQGQIIDAFAEMRIAADEKLADANERCMVCSLSRFEIDNAGGRFYQHIDKDHTPSNYLFYLTFLDSSCQDDDTGMMTFVRDCVFRSSTEFMPIGTCTMMNRDADEVVMTNELIKSKLDTAQQQVDQRAEQMDAQIDMLSQKLDLFMRKIDERI